MLELRKYLDELRNRYSIDDADFEIKLCDYLVENRWFDVRIDHTDELYYVDDIELNMKLNAFLIHYNDSTEKKIADLFSLYSSCSQQNVDFLKEYIAEFGMEADTLYYLLNFMIAYMPWDIKTCSNSEIEGILSDALAQLAKINYDALADFIIWCSQEKKTIYKSVTMVTNKTTKLKEAYDLQTYGNYLYHFFNEDYIEENQMYKKALDSPKYAKIWLYICIRLICAVRNTDLVRIPHPKLNYSSEVCLQRIKDGIFDDYDAKMIVGSVTILFDVLKYVPNKTKRFDNVPNIQLFIPTSLVKHFGILFAIVESQMQLADDSGSFIETVADYRTIKRVMGEEIASLFLEYDFNALSAAKSFMQIICNSDDLVDVEDEFKMKGYYLAGMARSHKGSYGEFQKTTIAYLRDNKLTGKSPEVVARELFERGSLSFILVFLLKTITGNKFNQYSSVEQTRMIQNSDMTPLMAENAVELITEVKNNTGALVNDLLSTRSMEEIVLSLHRIGNGDAVNKEEGQCILTAFEDGCHRNRTCLGCPYSVGDEFAVYTLTKEAKRLSGMVKDGVDVRKNQAILKLLLKRIDEFLTCYRTIYGDEATKILIKIIEENT